jgi:hypothetical protein
MLKRGESVGVLNIQPLVVKSLPHSPSCSKCEERKQYHEKMQFAHSIIQNIHRLGSSIVNFLKRKIKGWNSSEQKGPRTTLMDLVHIQELNKEEGKEK